MELVCPDPVAFTRWQSAMTQAGIALLVALGLFLVMTWAARPEGWSLRAACVLCAALALGGAVASFIIRVRLNDAAARVTLWFPSYPQNCEFGGSYGVYSPVFRPAAQAAIRSVGLVEQEAAIDLAVAGAIVVALLLCLGALTRATHRRELGARSTPDMTSVIADS